MLFIHNHDKCLKYLLKTLFYIKLSENFNKYHQQKNNYLLKMFIYYLKIETSYQFNL
jgi:hypothetical protein